MLARVFKSFRSGARGDTSSHFESHAHTKTVILIPTIFNLSSFLSVVKNRNRCFTTSDGKVQDFKKYGVSSKCKIDDNGLGVGMKLANFVYTR